MTSITSNKKSKHHTMKLWAAIVWIILWQLLSLYLDSDILLASPWKVLFCLLGLLKESSFWQAIFFTFFRICAGLLTAHLLAILFASLSYHSKLIQDFLAVPVTVAKSTPVASFIILVLIWIPSKNLSVFISFLMSFPVLYTNLLQGLNSMDGKMLEMAQVFRLSFFRRFRYIYLPQVFPFYGAASSLANSLCFKAGIAAEIIGLPRGSLGEKLYEAKIYLNTPELFAWTIVIILLSILFQRIFHFSVQLLMNKLEGR